MPVPTSLSWTQQGLCQDNRHSIVPLKGFYDAESYHQDYALHNPENPYILVCDRPKNWGTKTTIPRAVSGLQGQVRPRPIRSLKSQT